MDIHELVLNKLDKLDAKIDHHGQLLNSQTSRLDVYNAHLEEHMRRTDQVEMRVGRTEDRLIPLEDYTKFFMRFGKIVAGALTILATIAGVLRLFLE